MTNDPMTLVRWLTAGAGIAYVPLMWVINEINRGELEILLPRYQSDPRPVYALYTEKDKLPLKVQVVINSLTDYFVEVGKLFQEMHGRGEREVINIVLLRCTNLCQRVPLTLTPEGRGDRSYTEKD